MNRPPTYTIITIVHNACATVKIATQQVLRHLASHDARLVIFDNASNDGTELWLNALALRGDIELIRSKTEMADDEAVDFTLKDIDSPYVVVLDSGVFPVSDDWLPQLRRHLTGDVRAVNIPNPSCLMIERQFLRDGFNRASNKHTMTLESVDDSIHLAENVEKYYNVPRDINVVVGIRKPPNAPERLQNVKSALWALNFQDLPRWQYRIIVVEQDREPQLENALAPLADRYVFAYNPGAYNVSWGRNIGASLPESRNGILCLADADLLPQPDFLRRGLEAVHRGSLAFLPYTETVFMTAESTKRASLDRFDTPMTPRDAGRYRGRVSKNSVGLCIWVDSQLYHAVGGYDERFRGWGAEDREFYDRLRQFTTVERLPGRVLHLEATPPRSGTGRRECIEDLGRQR